MDRVEQVGGMLVALGTATAISATVGTVSMLAGGVVDGSDATEFWRTWWLGDTSGGLVVLPLMLAWARDPSGGLATHPDVGGRRRDRRRSPRSASIAVSTEEPVTYMVFPALIWVAFRFGAPGRDAVHRDHRRRGDRGHRPRGRARSPNSRSTTGR